MTDVDMLDDEQQRTIMKAVELGKLNSLAGHNICLTGHMSMPRNQMMALISALGGSICGAVSVSTSLLIAADPDSHTTKANSARRYGIRIISEVEFSEMIQVSAS